MIGDVHVNIGNFKVLHISGTSSLVIGKGMLSDLSSESKTNNGVGSAYGDGSNINMSPYKSVLNDQDLSDQPDYKGKSNDYHLGHYPVDINTEWEDM